MDQHRRCEFLATIKAGGMSQSKRVLKSKEGPEVKRYSEESGHVRVPGKRNHHESIEKHWLKSSECGLGDYEGDSVVSSKNDNAGLYYINAFIYQNVNACSRRKKRY